MRIVLFCGTHRGYLFLEKLARLVPKNSKLIVFSYKETAWEPPFVKKIQKLTKACGGQFYAECSLNNRRWSKFFKSKDIDLMFTVNWRYIIPEEIYSVAKKGAFVFHDSLLPKYRGFSPTVWAIINGEKATGVTLFHMAKKYDTGDIVDQMKVAIGPDDTIDIVLNSVTQAYLKILQKNFSKLISGRAPRHPQNHVQATYVGKRLPDDNNINWADNTSQIYDLIRAVTHPYPGAFTYHFDKKLYVWSARKLKRPRKFASFVPGRIVEVGPQGSVVRTGDGALLLTKVQIQNKKQRHAAKILNSVNITLGT